MPEHEYIVTGARGFLGRHIAGSLLAQGRSVATLTNRPAESAADAARVPADGARVPAAAAHVQAFPLAFDRPEELAEAMSGCRVLLNTYWIRYPMHGLTYEQATANSRTLFEAARRAGVSRVVHVSITNPSADSPYGYFRGKAWVEQALRESGMSYAILRPAVLFGDEGILVNNIAWALRHVPVFALFGDGSYRLQPIFVEDMAALAVEQAQASENVVLDAIGPETFTYRRLVEAIAAAIGVTRLIVSLPPRLALAVVNSLGWLKGDRIVTPEEMDALMAGLLCVDSPPAGPTRLTDWLKANSETLGRSYMSEQKRRRP